MLIMLSMLTPELESLDTKKNKTAKDLLTGFEANRVITLLSNSRKAESRVPVLANANSSQHASFAIQVLDLTIRNPVLTHF